MSCLKTATPTAGRSPAAVGRWSRTGRRSTGNPERAATRGREPVHVFNNYFFSNSDVGVACQANAGCVVEGNYFEDVEEPMSIHYAGPTGRMIQRNNVFFGESGAPDVGGSVIEPSTFYGYALQNALDIKTIVIQGAGVGKIGF